MPRQLIVKSLNQLLDECVEEERSEAEYRRGYRDGYAAVINALFELPINIVDVDSDLLTRLFSFWQKRLSAWQNAPLDQQIEPPNLDWQQAAGEKSSPVSLTLDSAPTAKRLGVKV